MVVKDFFDNLKVGARWDVGVAINRSNALPLDANSVFASFEDAQNYAAGNPPDGMLANAYPGQVLAVVTDTETAVYYIDAHMEIQPVGNIKDVMTYIGDLPEDTDAKTVIDYINQRAGSIDENKLTDALQPYAKTDELPIKGTIADDKVLSLNEDKQLSAMVALSYDSDDKKIKLTGKDGADLGSINAAPFIESPEEIYVGNDEMPETATIQIILDDVDEDQVLKDDLRDYIDKELQNIKCDEFTSVFGDVVTSIGYDGIAAGTSLKDKTVKDVLIMMLGIKDKESPKSIVEYIIDNNITAYSGSLSHSSAIEYNLLDANEADYTNQGFYTLVDEDDNIINAGYQLTIEGNSEADAQIISIPANAVIKMAYRYDLGGTNTWLAYTFDLEDEANYWLLGEQFITTVNGEEVVYQTYVYNLDIVGDGDAITTTEYWRFEIEVTN